MHSRRTAAGPNGRRRYNLMPTLGRRREGSPHSPAAPPGLSWTALTWCSSRYPSRQHPHSRGLWAPCVLSTRPFTYDLSRYLRACSYLRAGADQLPTYRHLPCAAHAPSACQHINGGGRGLDEVLHGSCVSESTIAVWMVKRLGDMGIPCRKDMVGVAELGE